MSRESAHTPSERTPRPPIRLPYSVENSPTLDLHAETRSYRLTDAEGIVESGEHSRFGQAYEQANGTRWNQMELFTTILRYFLVT
jgi:hypothetical protein